MGERSLRIYLLGRFEVRLGERLIIDDSWRPTPSSVLKLLALHPGGGHRCRVATILWPDRDGPAAAAALRKALYHLATAVTDNGLATLVSVRGSTLSLPSGTWTDVDEFRCRAAVARARGDGADLYEGALSLYEGELLPADVHLPWTEPRRQQLQELRCALLAEVSRLYEAAGRFDLAEERLYQVLECDSLDEDAHRGLMRLYLRSGHRERAVRQYERLRHRMREELDVEPSLETQALWQAVRET